MVLLDANAFNVVLTPEAAITSVQQAVASKNWKSSTLSDIKLVYVPFYIFSFDVAEGNVPTGKAALNAYTGELNDFIPYLLERPLEKSRATDDRVQVEVESTTISQSEVKELASVKIANTVGAKKDQIVVSAVSKIYVPFYRIWVDVAGDNFKIEVDACLGSPNGIDVIPARQKTWEENTQDTLTQMRTPAGFATLTSKTLAEASKVGIPNSGNKYVQWIILGVVILVIAYFAFGSAFSSLTCKPYDDYLSKPTYAGLFGPRKITPSFNVKDQSFSLSGTCSFSSREKKENAIIILAVKQGGLQISQATQTFTIPLTQQVSTRTFNLVWNSSSSKTGDYELDVKLIN